MLDAIDKISILLGKVSVQVRGIPPAMPTKRVLCTNAPPPTAPEEECISFPVAGKQRKVQESHAERNTNDH